MFRRVGRISGWLQMMKIMKNRHIITIVEECPGIMADGRRYAPLAATNYSTIAQLAVSRIGAVLRQNCHLRTWFVVWLYALTALVAFMVSGLRMDAQLTRSMLTIAVVGSSLGGLVAWRSPDFALGRAAGGILQQALCGCGTIWLECVGLKSNAPFFDKWAMTFDQAIGYDWHSFASFVSSFPLLHTILGLAYNSLLLQTMATAFLLGIVAPYRMSRFVVASAIVLMFSAGIFAFLPEATLLVYTHVSNAEFVRLGFPATHQWLNTINGIRAGTLNQLTVGDDVGIIGFPSYHCAGALLIVWAIWPMRAGRYIFVPLNIALIASTLIFGWHYMADLCGGALVMGLGVWLSDWIIPEARKSVPAVAMGRLLGCEAGEGNAGMALKIA